MKRHSSATDRFDFGPFRLDQTRLELFRGDDPVRLQLQPLRLLALLVREAGRVVTRDEIRDEIWGHDHLEVDQGINFCVRQVRAALGDDARSPSYVETIPRRGYRFVCPVAAPRKERVRSLPGRPSRRALWVAATAVAVITTATVALLVSPAGRRDPLVTRPLSAVPAEARESYRRAEVYLSRGMECESLEAARSLLEAAVASDPEFAAAHAKLAIVLSSGASGYAGDAAAKAVSHAERALALDPDLPEAHTALGHLRFHQSDLDGALVSFQTALGIEPDHAESLAALGYTQRRMGAWDGALTSFERAFERDRWSMELAYALANTNEFLRRFEQVERYVADMVAIDPDHWAPHATRALVALAARGDTEEAWRIIRRASAAAPLSALILNSSTLTRVFADRVADVGAEWTATEAGLPPELFDYRMSIMYEQTGAHERANRHLEAARTALEANLAASGYGVDGLRSEANAILAAIYARLGDPARSRELVSVAARLAPLASDAVAGVRTRQRIAEVFVILGEHDRALDHVEYLLSSPSLLTEKLLVVDPVWAPLAGRLDLAKPVRGL